MLLLSLSASAQDLSWLSGHWVTENSEEVWSLSRDGNLMGHNRQFKDGKVVFFEHLRLERKPEGTLYHACPLGKGWTTFRLTESRDREALFTNPQHDFPTHIHYRLEGQTLKVMISDGAEKTASWTFQRKL